MMLYVILLQFADHLDGGVGGLHVFTCHTKRGRDLRAGRLTRFPSSRLNRVTRHVVGVCGRLRGDGRTRGQLGHRLARGVTRRLGAPVTDVRNCLRAVLSRPAVDSKREARFLRHDCTRARQLDTLIRSVTLLGHVSSSRTLARFRVASVARVIEGVISRATVRLDDRRVAFSGRLPRGVILGTGPGLVCDVFHGLASGTVTCTNGKATVALATRRARHR